MARKSPEYQQRFAVIYVIMCVILKNEEFFDIIKTLLKKFIKKEV